MKSIASRISQFDSSDFRRVFELQENLDKPIDLSVGIPEELTPEHIKQAGIRAIQNDKTTYTPANGFSQLRLRIARKLIEDNKLEATEDNVTIVPGLTTGLLLVYLAILNPGDEVIINDPYYPPYTQLVSSIGGVPITIKVQSDFQLDLKSIEAAVTPKTKAIIINSPNNPTGAVYPENSLRKLAAIASKRGIFVISDEIYEHFAYFEKPTSIGNIYENCLTLNGFSKEYAMTGWRLGYIHGPQRVIDAINELLQYMVFSSSSIAQHAALVALDKRPQLLEKYRKKRDYVVRELEDIGYSVAGAQGAYYVFLKTPSGLSDLEFAEKAAQNNLIIVPGRAFSFSQNHFRLSYGTDIKQLKRGLKIIKSLS